MEEAEKNSFKTTPTMDSNSPTAVQANNNSKVQMPSSAPQSPHVPNAGTLPRRIINKIPLDFKKLQDAGLHRKLAEALSKQNTNTTKNIASASTNQWASNSSTSSAAAPTTAATPASHSHIQMQLQKPPQLEQTTAINPLGNNKPLSATEQSLHVKKLIKNKILSKSPQSKPQEQHERQQPTFGSSIAQTANSETNKDSPTQLGGFSGPIAKADLTARSKPPLLLNLVNQLPKQRARCVSVTPRRKATRPTSTPAAAQGRAPPAPTAQGRAPPTPDAVQPKSPPPLIVLENKVLAPNERIDFRTLRLPNSQAGAIAATPPSIVTSSATVIEGLQSANTMKESANKPPNEQPSEIPKPTAEKTPLKKIILNVNKRKLPREQIVELAKQVRKQALQHVQQQKQPSTVISTGDAEIVLSPVTNITTVSQSKNDGTSLVTQASSSSTLTSSSATTSALNYASIPVITSSLMTPVLETQTAPPSVIAPKTVMTTMPLTEDMHAPISTQYVESGSPAKAANSQESLPVASLTTSETDSSPSSAENSSKMEAQEVAADELSAVDFIAQLTAIEDVDASNYFELSPEELSLNAKFGCSKIPEPPKRSIKPDDDLAIGKILQMQDMDILHATMNVNDNKSNVLCISPNAIKLESSAHPTKVNCVLVKGNPGGDLSSSDKFKPLKVTAPKHVYTYTKRKIPATKAPTTVDTTSTRVEIQEQQESEQPAVKVRLLDEAEKKMPCKPKRGKINLVQRNKNVSKLNVTQKLASDTTMKEASLDDSTSQDVENDVQSKQDKTINLVDAIPNKNPCINVVCRDIEDKKDVGQESRAAISIEIPPDSSANDIKERSSEGITEQIESLQPASTSSNEDLDNTAGNNRKSKTDLDICEEAGEKAVEDMNEQIVVKSKASEEIEQNVVVANTAADKTSVISGIIECASTEGHGSTKPTTSSLIPEGSANERDLTQLYHPPKVPKLKLNTLKKNDNQNGSVLEQELPVSTPGSAVSLLDIVQQQEPPPQEGVGIQNLVNHLSAENIVPLSKDSKAEEKIKAPRKKLVKTRPVLSSKRPAKAAQPQTNIANEVKPVEAVQTKKQTLDLDGTKPNGGQQVTRSSTSDDDATCFHGFDESSSINIFKSTQSKETDISDDNSPDNDETEEERHSDKEVFAKKPKTEPIVINNVSENACEPESKITCPNSEKLAPKELVYESTLTKETETSKANTQQISAEIRGETNILKETEVKQDAPINTEEHTRNEDTLQKSLSMKQASAEADHLTEATKEHIPKSTENIAQKEEHILQESTSKKDSSINTEDPQTEEESDNSIQTASKINTIKINENTNQFPKKKRVKKDTIKDTLDKKHSSVSMEDPPQQTEDTLNEASFTNQSSATTGEISKQVIEMKKTSRKTTSKKQTEELSEIKLNKKYNLKETEPEKQLAERDIELPVKPKRTRRTMKEIEKSSELKGVIKTQTSDPMPKEILPDTTDIKNEMVTSTPVSIKRKRGRPRKSDVIPENITNINTSLSENCKLLDSYAATTARSTIISSTSALDSSIPDESMTLTVKRRRKKGHDMSTSSMIAESTETVSESDKQTSDHYRRLLLIRNRAQLDSDEDLRKDGHGNGDRQCGLCLARCNSAAWQAHIGEHYGVGWPIEAPTPLLTRSVILKMMKTYIKSGKKNLSCRLCERKLTSALGMFLHIEGCGSKERIVCEFCKSSYTKLSFPGHSRICTERFRAPSEEKPSSQTELKKNNEALVYSNAGRAKRKSTLKAETKLEKIAAQSKDNIADETPKDFDGDVSDYDMTADKESSDCEGSEGVNSNIDESRSKSTIPRANKIGQKLLYTRINVKNVMKERWEYFAQRNYATSTLYPHLLPSYEKLLGVEELLPPMPSMRYAYGRVDDIGWSQLRPLESVNKENESICYLGKAIKELAWVPLPSTVKTQYLLCSLRNKMLGYSRQFKDKPEEALLLLLQCETLAIEEDKDKVFPLQTRLHYGIYMPQGAVHSLAFMPSGGYDESINRMALLAVGTRLGAVIYGLPLRVKKESDKKNKQSDVIVVLEPLVTLCLDIDNPMQDACTKICWSESSGHGLLVSGYASGNVAFFDISDDQGLNYIERNDQIYFLPTNFFYFGERNINYLELHYDTNGARWLAIGTMVRKLWIYDIANLAQPLAIMGDTVCNMYMGGVNWPPLWESLAIGCTEVYKSQFPRVLALNPSGISFSHSTVDLTLSSPRSVHFNWQQLTMVTVTDNGDVVFVQCNQFNLEMLIHKRTKDCRTISVTEPYRLVDTPEPNSISPDHFKKDYGLLLKPLENVPNKKKSNYINIKRRPSFDLLNLLRLNCVRWNWNECARNWVAVGAEHGLLRIINFESEKHFSRF